MATTVTFASAGAGSLLTSAATTTLSTSWTHTISTSNPETLAIVIVGVNWNGKTSNSVTVGASYGGQAMSARNNYSSQVGSGTRASNDPEYQIFVFHLLSPPSGSQTVTVTATAPGGIECLNGNSVAYQGVDYFAPTGFIGGDATNTMSSAPGAYRVVLIAGGDAASVAATGYTSRYLAGSTGTTQYLNIVDLAGTGSPVAVSPMVYSYGAATPLIEYELLPSGLDGNIRPACDTGSGLYNTVSTGTGTFTHTTNVGDNLAALLVISQSNMSASPAQPTATFGGTSMTYLGTSGVGSATFMSSTTYSRTSVFGILGIAPGAATVTCALGSTGTKTVAVVSYANVDSFGTAAGGLSTTVSVTGSPSGAIFWGGIGSGFDPVLYSARAAAFIDGFISSNYVGAFDTKLASSSLSSFTGVGVPINASKNAWFSSY
jgi:hypothetical protein